MMVYRNFLIFSPYPGGDMEHSKGGAIYAYAVHVKIYTSTFESNIASEVSG
jgi:hypothetical protein